MGDWFWRNLFWKDDEPPIPWKVRWRGLTKMIISTPLVGGVMVLAMFEASHRPRIHEVIALLLAGADLILFIFGMSGLVELLLGMPINVLNEAWPRMNGFIKCICSIGMMVVFFFYLGLAFGIALAISSSLGLKI